MNCHPKPRNSPNLSKEEKNSIDRLPKNERQKHKCPTCQQHSFLLCYACCYQIACENCFSQQHYEQCKRRFNQHTINLLDLATEEDHRGKKHRKGKQNQRCQRCLEMGEKCEYCTKCKVNLCGGCIQETHKTGKFSHHVLTKIQSSPCKYKKLETFLTENDEAQENVMKKSTKDNIEGQKPKERVTKINSTPVQNKKGRSSVKPINKNQQNSAFSTVGRQKHQVSKDFDANPINLSGLLSAQKWQYCSQHHKIRTVLTENCDLICSECYQAVKLVISKVKTIDVTNWLKDSVNSDEIKLNFAASLSQFSIKMKQLQAQFSNYRQTLSDEYTRKQEILTQRYKNNLSNLQKWQNLYKANINNIIKTCVQNLDTRSHILETQSNSPTKTKEKGKHELTKFINFKNLLALEQVAQYKKEFYLQEQQYQFRVNQINNDYFEDMIKNFNFVRRKIDNDQLNSNQKSISKMQNSNYLRQSRLSNSSIVTDRKTLKRDQSFQKSTYYELSNNSNLIKRSMSKDLNKKDDISKDISQRILFSNQDIEKQKKNSISSQNVKKFDKQLKNSQHFFESMHENIEKPKGKQKKQPLQLSNYCFKDVKYVNLENFLTEKLDKIYDEKKDSINANKLNEKANMFTNDLEINTEIVELHTQQTAPPSSQSRLTCSNINSTNPSFNKIPFDSSTNSSIHATNKNKRKSDYMQMRDRLRKPNIMNKIGK